MFNRIFQNKKNLIKLIGLFLYNCSKNSNNQILKNKWMINKYIGLKVFKNKGFLIKQLSMNKINAKSKNNGTR